MANKTYNTPTGTKPCDHVDDAGGDTGELTIALGYLFVAAYTSSSGTRICAHSEACSDGVMLAGTWCWAVVEPTTQRHLEAGSHFEVRVGAQAPDRFVVLSCRHRV
jgi:hypothetical protein